MLRSRTTAQVQQLTPQGFVRTFFACAIVSLVIWLLLMVDSAASLAEPLPSSPDVSAVEQSVPKALGLDANNIPSEKVNQFINAYLQVVSLIDHREGELQAAETESESLRIEHDIEADAIATIEKAGLSRQEYLQLLSLANVDPEFGERVATLLQEGAN